MDLNTSVEDSQAPKHKYQKLKKLTTQVFIHNDEKVDASKYVALVRKRQKPLLGTLDIIICLTILSPCVVGVWRGIWTIMDLHEAYFPAWQSIILGLSIHFVFVLIQDMLNDIIRSKSSSVWIKIFHLIMSRIYVYIFVVACNMHWRGCWIIFDKYIGVILTDKGVVLKHGLRPILIVTFGCLLLIISMRCLCNSLAAPFLFFLDRKNKMYTVPTRFKSKMSEKTSLYILDCLFSVLVIGTLVVFVWRGAWALIDIFLFPENEVWSAWSSLIVGYSAVAIAFMLQPFMKWLCDRITGVARLLAADLFLILSLIGTINVWRGIWNLLNLYLLPDNLELSCWITHWFCLIILILLGCSNSLLVRGVYIDAEEPAGKCVVFPCYYLRLIFQEQKLKRIQNDQKTEMGSVKPFENNHVITDQNHKEGDV